MVFFSSAVLTTVNDLVSLTIRDLVQHPGLEVLDLGLFSFGGIFFLFEFYGHLLDLPTIFCATPTKARIFLSLGYGGPPTICEEVVIIIQGNRSDLFYRKPLVLFSLAPAGVHVVSEE